MNLQKALKFVKLFLKHALYPTKFTNEVHPPLNVI
jgi:hypothetical protein